ncbi:MAG: hypothetical protein AVDCRST_MAG86-968 [uncultured Truepera sp.]|uniref:Glucose/Sorbosone dehydrogenase domain-containing protein n=1 Tax=uncultured Truepera sp. TaxID=543023 RepID=A0A6J4UXF1_9DEIN|nr:MAG: hypothetical protein AVDCRST_MAG86-968 [uncultured Truepera sp.]
MLGKLLRFRVDEAGLSVPADNPFVHVEGAEAAVWAYGLCNPWRFSFDREGDEIYMADVGETAFEEINVQRLRASRGANYGWPLADGPRCRVPGGCAGFVPPALSYTHAEGCSVTGGYVYRGAALPELTGRYLYGDFWSGVIWAAERRDGLWQAEVVADTSLILSSFARDAAGEVYVLDYAGGAVYRLAEAK